MIIKNQVHYFVHNDYEDANKNFTYSVMINKSIMFENENLKNDLIPDIYPTISQEWLAYLEIVREQLLSKINDRYLDAFLVYNNLIEYNYNFTSRYMVYQQEALIRCYYNCKNIKVAQSELNNLSKAYSKNIDTIAVAENLLFQGFIFLQMSDTVEKGAT